MARSSPNFLVTGTPGVGKSTFSELLASRLGLTHVPVGQLIAERHLWEERDEERDCTVYSEALLDDAIREILDSHQDGGVIFDFHAPDIVEKEDIDFVVVVVCGRDILYQRLVARGYSTAKVRENADAEMIGTIADEVAELFDEEMIIEVVSEVPEDLEQAVEAITQRLTGTE
jgi:adenylate kinase